MIRPVFIQRFHEPAAFDRVFNLYSNSRLGWALLDPGGPLVLPVVTLPRWINLRT